MRVTVPLLALALAAMLTACSWNDGDTGPEPRLCVDLSFDECDSRPDCAVAWGRPYVRLTEGGWCLDIDGPREPVTCYLPGSGVGPGVTVQLGPVDDPERCYEFPFPVPLGDRWERCEGPFTPALSCP